MPVKNTAPERRVVAALRGALPSERFKELERQPSDIATRIDLFFRFRGTGRKGVAIFIDGCSWHGCAVHGRTHDNPEHGLHPERVTAQKLHDRRARAALRAAGYVVLEIWEHEVATDLGAVVRRIAEAIGAPLTSHRTARAGRAR